MTWEKIDGAPHWLEIRHGKRKISYRVNYRAKGVNLVRTLDGDFETWRKAEKAGDKLITQAKTAGVPLSPDLIRCEDLLDEQVEIAKASRAEATYKQKEIMVRVHLKPWLNANCAYVKDLNATVWDLYRAFKRRQNPNVTLKAHAEVFGGLVAYACRKGILSRGFVIDYDRERDDFAEDGMVIPKEDLVAMLKAKPLPPKPGKPYPYAKAIYYFESWRDRIIIQRATGMRPGEVRLLKKDRVVVVGDRAVIRLKKEDTKTRQARSVPVAHPGVVEILRRRMEGESPYLFPQREDQTQPVGANLDGWYLILERAQVNMAYTPHDLRHTYLSDMFRNSNNPALICHTCGLSLEEAQDTYLHFSEDDGFLVGNEAARRLTYLGAV